MHKKSFIFRRAGWLRSALVSWLFVTLFAGCGIDHQKETTDLADRLYDRIGTGDFPAAAELYGEPFFQRVSRDQWIQTLQQVENTLGAYERHSLIQARQQTFGPAENPGEVYTVLMYRVNYGDQEAIEQLTFSTTQQPIRLVNHQIMSELVAVNLDASSNQMQVAATGGGTRQQSTRPPETPREPTPEPEPDPEPELAVEIAREAEPVDPEPAELIAARERESLEERISNEVRRIVAVDRDPEISRSVGQLTITGINPRQNRILVGLTLVKQGEAVGANLPLTLWEVEDRRIIFQDNRGAFYDKWFLTSDR